jgi:hypothetical protein
MTSLATPTDLKSSAAAPHVNRAVALWSILAFWAFYFVLNTARMAIAGSAGQLGMLPRRGAVVLVGIALTLVMYSVLHRWEGKSMRFLLTTAALVSVPASIAYATFNFAAFYLVYPSDSDLREMALAKSMHGSGAIPIITESAVSWYFFIVAWGVLYVALSYAAKVGHVERQAAAYRSEAQAAQLRALRYQINPHFLFTQLPLDPGAAATYPGSRTDDHESGNLLPYEPGKRSIRGGAFVRRNPDAAALSRYRTGPVSRASVRGG